MPPALYIPRMRVTPFLFTVSCATPGGFQRCVALSRGTYLRSLVVVSGAGSFRRCSYRSCGFPNHSVWRWPAVLPAPFMFACYTTWLWALSGPEPSLHAPPLFSIAFAHRDRRRLCSFAVSCTLLLPCGLASLRWCCVCGVPFSLAVNAGSGLCCFCFWRWSAR